MDSSVRALIEVARNYAVSRGLNLPLSKARNVLAMCIYGAPYSAVMAAEKAGKTPLPRASPERATIAAKTYRCDARLVLDVAQAAVAAFLDSDALDEGDEFDAFEEMAEEGTPQFGIQLMGAVRRVVMGVEHERRRGTLTWADFGSIDEVHDEFGSDATLEFDNCVAAFTALIDQAITTDGHSLPKDLRAIEKDCRAVLKDQASLDTSWISDIEASYKTPSKKPPKVRQPERFAINLLIAPDFDAIQDRILSGQMQAPRVNMHTVNYSALADYLGETFNFKGSRLRVPNDLLDQATLHTRALGIAKGDPEGHDFLRVLLNFAASSSDQVVDVRQGWRPLHHIQDRTFAPPPCALSMVMESHDYEDAAQVLVYMRMRVGITAGTPQGMLDRANATTEGRIGPKFQAFLQEMFGVGFKPFVAFTHPCFERVPNWANSLR